ncbi:glycosyltransferase family 2 protein [Cesiribacter andamanensis]|uniref:Spore coat polysaccharide biosynthesis protein spsA n=1 Tax=Cesiribacter andamanensis AMV16 TaxID=1279009 RepID=M7N1I1_9BACT|nr:glycosyltransferase [Cesiribacter andamanensis]EMR01076.1 Spore coat polysaccharide biosynthesis protein spsA [Cesiribacter andamanensis AMV16]
MPAPKLSVLLPVYNAERFLAQAIDSILQQTFAHFELLLLDDCSTDRSAEIIRSYSDPRIRYYRNEQNMGISATLNRGISLAASPLIARMDADDISYPSRLEKQLAYLQAHPDCALLSCWVRVITEEGELVRIDDFKPEYYYYNLTFECWMYHPSIVFRKAAAEQIGGYTVPYSEDFELFWQFSRRFKVHNLPEILMDYRISPQSLHQVQKKPEYDLAQHQQVLRNIRYYMGSTYRLSYSQIECLRHNPTPLLQEGSLHLMVECLQKLAVITKAIEQRDNPNRDPAAIRKAAYFKRRHILLAFARNLPYRKSVLLLAKSREWGLLYFLVHSFIKRRLKL